MSSMAQEQLLNQLQDPSARAKLSSKFGGYVKDRLREASFVEQIIPSEGVTRNECQVSVNHDSLVKIEYLAPKSRAAVITFRGEPEAQFIRGNKAEVPFITIMSNMFQKPEQEFLAYNFPLGQVVEEQSVMDLAEVQDREWLIHTESAVQALQAEANGGSVTSLDNTTLGTSSVVEFSVIKGELAKAAGTNDAISLAPQKSDFVNLKNIIDGRRLETGMFLMTNYDHNQCMKWTIEDVGSPVLSETLYEGMKKNSLLGIRVVKTIKTDILRPGNIYSYTAPQFLGRNYILNQVKFYIDKVINMVKFCCWKDIAMSLLNISAVGKLETYSGDATTLDADGILSDVSPVAESGLGAENNRVGSRLYYPAVVQF